MKSYVTNEDICTVRKKNYYLNEKDHEQIIVNNDDNTYLVTIKNKDYKYIYDIKEYILNDSYMYLELNFNNSFYRDDNNILYFDKYYEAYLENFKTIDKICKQIEKDFVFASKEKTFVLIYNLDVQLNSAIVSINIQITISIDSFNWKNDITLTLFNSNKSFVITGKSNIIQFLSKYVNENNPNLNNFINILKLFSFPLSEIQDNEYLKAEIIDRILNDITEIKSIKKLRIGKKKLEKIHSALLSYFNPLVISENEKVYIKQYNFRKPIMDNIIRLVRDGKEIPIEGNNKNCRIAFAKVCFLNNFSSLNPYNGEIIDMHFEIIYRDNDYIIIENKYECSLQYYVNLNNVWIMAIENELKDIKERYNVLKLLL